MTTVDAIAGLYHRAVPGHQGVAIYLLELGAILTCVIVVAYDDHLAMVLLALDEGDGILARGETREGVFESVAYLKTVDTEVTFGHFSFHKNSFYLYNHNQYVFLFEN